MHSQSSFSAFALFLALACSSVRADAPCDIYSAGGTPCYAAHSTVRALYDSYTDALYQVIRGSDGATDDIKPLSNGVANISTQESFCSGTTCLISLIYDQSGRGNHLTQAPPGSAAQGPDSGGKDYLASAIGAPVFVSGSKAYGVFISPYTGYRNNNINGSVTGDAAEGMYAIFDGTHYNDKCCFDYGNAETNSQDTGNGHMEAIYFGNGGYKGSGNGPWVQADLENGLFSGGDRKVNDDNKSIQARFVTAILKGKAGQWALRGGDATSGLLSTMYSGARPSGDYNPMHKEGAVVLGVGGDNSDRAQGTFYEGVMTTGYPSDDTENKVQANIVAAKYTTAGLVSPNFKFAKGSTISLRATTACCTTRYIAHTGSTVNTQVVSSSSSTDVREQASWVVHTGLGNSDCYSFESKDTPGSYIRHSNYQLRLDANDNSKLFSEDATFCPQTGINGADHFSIRSWSYPTRYWRHFNAILYIASNGGPHDFDATASFNDDVSFAITTGLA